MNELQWYNASYKFKNIYYELWDENLHSDTRFDIKIVTLYLYFQK